MDLNGYCFCFFPGHLKRDFLGSVYDHLAERTSWEPKGRRWRTKISPCSLSLSLLYFCFVFVFFFLPSHILSVFLKVLGIVELWKACTQISMSKTFQLCDPVLNSTFVFYKTRILLSVRNENVKDSVPSKWEPLNKRLSILLFRLHILLFSDPLPTFVFLLFSPYFFSVNVSHPFHIPLSYLKTLKE